jgi:YbbR domain-containing protein
MDLFRRWVKTLPTLGAAFVLAMVVWVLAVTSTDPAEERAYQQPVPIEIKSQNPSLLITNEIPEQTSVVLRAPLSVWEKIYADSSAVRAFMDLSGIEAGSHTVPVKIQIAYQPSAVVSNEVASVDLVLEELASKDFNVELVTFGSPASGYELGLSTLSQERVVVSGPESKVNAVQSVRATFILGNSNESIERDTSLVAVDEDGNVITGVSIAPANITIYQEITQRGGYRSVVVKVAFSGHVSTGYRLTNITVNPPIITVYSEDPALVENLQGYIETAPLNLDGVDSDLDLNLALNMPQGISLDGGSTVMVHVGVSPLEGSLTLASQKVEIIGLEQGLIGRVSPAFVDVIISGPLPMLNKLTSSDVHVIMDLSGEGIGTYQKQPSVTISIPSLTADSILPDTLDVVISVSGTPTPKP